MPHHQGHEGPALVDRTEVARKNLAKGRAKAARRRKKAAALKEAEKQARIERIAGPAGTGEKVARVWAYKDVSYHTIEGVGVAIAAHHHETRQIEAIGAWASLFRLQKGND